MKRIAYLALTCAILSIFQHTAAAQTKFLQKMKMASGDSMAVNMTEVRYAVKLSDGRAKLFYGNPTTVYETTSSFASIVSGSCGNLVQFTQYIGSGTQVVALNPKWVAKATAVPGVAKTNLFMVQSGDLRVVSGTYQTVSGLLSACGSGGGGDNWGSQYVRTDATLGGKGTLAEPLTLAQQGATSGQVLSWNGTTWLPITLSGTGVSAGDKGDIDVVNAISDWRVDTNAITNVKMADNAIGSAEIINGSVALTDMADMATASLIYRKTAGTGAPEVNTLATLKTDLSLAGTNSGDITLSGQNYLSIAGQVITANPVDLSGTNVTGTLAAARFGALTGDVTNTAGSYATTVNSATGSYFGFAWTSAAPAGTVNNWPVSPFNQFHQSSSVVVTGISMTAAVGVAKQAIIYNAGVGTITFKDQNAGSSTGSQFILPGNTDFVLNVGETAVFRNYGVSQKWRLMGGYTPTSIDTLTYSGSTLSISLRNDNVPAKTVTIASGGSVSDGDKGDIDVSSSGTVWKVDTMVVDPTTNMAVGNARPGYVMEWNGSRWAQTGPDYGNVYRDSISARTRQSYFIAPTVTPSLGLIQWDVDTAQTFTTTLTANATLLLPEHIKPGGRYTAVIKQNSVGGWSLSFGDGVKIFDHDGQGIAKTAGSTTVIDFVSDGSSLYGTATKYGVDEGFDLVDTYYDSLLFALEPRRSVYRGIASTPLTAYGQAVSEVVDASSNSLKVGNGSGPSADPLLEKVDGRIGWHFDGTDDRMFVRGGQYLVPYMQNANWSIGLWVKMNANGSNVWIFSQNAGGGSGQGLNISRTAGNLLQVYLTEGATVLFTYTTTATLTTTNGWTWVQFRRLGATGEVKMIPTVGAPETGTAAFTNGTGTAATTPPLIGCYKAGTNFMSGWVGNIYIFNRYISDVSIARFRDFNPESVNFGSHARVRQYNTFDPSKITSLVAWYDMSDITTMFTDAGATTQVTTNGDLVYVLKNKNATTGNIPRYAECTATGERATFNTNQQNSLGAVTWTTGKRHFFREEVDLPLTVNECSIFMAFKCTDTTGCTLLTDNSSKRLTVSGVSGSVFAGNQFASISPVDSFRNNSIYFFGSQINKLGWNIWEFRIKAGHYYISVNGKNLVEVPQYTYAWSIVMIGSTSSAMKGQIGEILWYNNYLDNTKSDLVTSYLKTKWGLSAIVSSSGLNDDEDAGRTTFIEGIGKVEDYPAFPGAIQRMTAPIMPGTVQNDTLYFTYKLSDVHNDSYDTTQGIMFRRYVVNSNGTYTQIGFEERIFGDIVSPAGAQRDRGAAFGFLPDGRTMWTGTEYDGQASIGGRDSTRGIWRIRETNGTLGAITPIVHPTYPQYSGWFAPVDYIQVYNGAWYLIGYGQPTTNSTAKYRLSLIKSTNSGSSWTVVREWDGNTMPWTSRTGASMTGGISPEEPILRRLSDGRWVILFREDLAGGDIFTMYTKDIDSWTSVPKATVRGQARPGFLETEGHILVVATRQPGTFAAVYYVSYDMGAAWSSAKHLDLWRNTNGGVCEMYSAIVDSHNGYITIFWGASMSDGSQGPANISKRLIKLRLPATITKS